MELARASWRVERRTHQVADFGSQETHTSSIGPISGQPTQDGNYLICGGLFGPVLVASRRCHGFLHCLQMLFDHTCQFGSLLLAGI